MASTEFKDHFSTHAAAYAAHRPSYPPSLIDYLADLAGDHRLAVDCACGNGQLSVLLAARFRRVIGTDASADQIRHAAPYPRVKYRTAPAEHTGLPAGIASLITVAQAAHWLDLPLFYAEALRIAQPHAPVALITYGVIETDDDVGRIVRRFYDDTLETFGPPERRHVATAYRDLPFPFDEVEAPMFRIEATWPLTRLIDYIETWSVVRKIEGRVGRGPIDKLRRELQDAWAARDERPVHWPLSMRVGFV
jgi:SAM-dependent methyltransferase